MTDLLTWLRAQLDAEERDARAASDGVVDWIAGDVGANGEDEAGEHIANWLPSRVLAEVAAKRAILDWTERLDDFGTTNNLWAMPEVTTVWALLASPYSHLPGYQEDWKP